MTKITKILITDDSMISRKSIIRLLKGSDYIIDQASNGRDAIEKVLKGDYDMMLLDLLMPDMTGFDVLKYFKDNSVKIPVIVISADIQTASKELCFEYGAKEFLNKPPTSDELIEAIEKHTKK